MLSFWVQTRKPSQNRYYQVLVILPPKSPSSPPPPLSTLHPQSHEGRDHDCFIHQCTSTLGTQLGTKTPITRKARMNCRTPRWGEPGPTSNGECHSTPSNRLPRKHTVRQRLKAPGSKQRRVDCAAQGTSDQPQGHEPSGLGAQTGQQHQGAGKTNRAGLCNLMTVGGNLLQLVL